MSIVWSGKARMSEEGISSSSELLFGLIEPNIRFTSIKNHLLKIFTSAKKLFAFCLSFKSSSTNHFCDSSLISNRAKTYPLTSLIDSTDNVRFDSHQLSFHFAG